jgi:hypothetical protein
MWFITDGNWWLLDTSQILQQKDPATQDPLQMKDPNDPEGPTIPATFEFVQTEVVRFAGVVEKKRHAVSEFLTRFTDTTAINAGLAEQQATRIAVDIDVVSLGTHKASIDNVVAISPTETSFRQAGELLSLYSPEVDADPNPNIISLRDRGINAFQDLLNAIAIELTGVCSALGITRYTTVQDIKRIVNGRISTAKQAWSKTPKTPETQGMKTVLDYVDGEIGSTQTVNDLTALGQYVDSQVPQLPLVRRWWNL